MLRDQRRAGMRERLHEGRPSPRSSTRARARQAVARTCAADGVARGVDDLSSRTFTVSRVHLTYRSSSSPAPRSRSRLGRLDALSDRVGASARRRARRPHSRPQVNARCRPAAGRPAECRVLRRGARARVARMGSASVLGTTRNVYSAALSSTTRVGAETQSSSSPSALDTTSPLRAKPPSRRHRLQIPGSETPITWRAPRRGSSAARGG